MCSELIRAWQRIRDHRTSHVITVYAGNGPTYLSLQWT